MADPAEKLVLKPDVTKKFLSNYSYTSDRESFMYLDLLMANKNIDALNNTLLEFKQIQTLDLSGNNIADINVL